ncbi:MAG: hypothetical protein JWL84_3277 [Rhodospirillales bacterium]|nr:hypothetical protein [Rhodospirillales bacterium]
MSRSSVSLAGVEGFEPTVAFRASSCRPRNGPLHQSQQLGVAGFDHNWCEPKPRDNFAQPVTVARVNNPWTAEAIHLLGTAFPSDQTQTGEAFWFDIVKRLHRIRDKGR